MTVSYFVATEIDGDKLDDERLILLGFFTGRRK